MREFTITEAEAGQRFDKYLHRILPEAGTGFLYKMLRKKNITLDGRKADGRELLAVGDRVCIYFSDETFAKFAGAVGTAAFSPGAVKKGSEILGNAPTRPQPEERGRSEEQYIRAFRTLEARYHGIPVVFEDADILAVDKPVGLLSQKARPEDLSLNEWFIGYLLANGKTDSRTFGYYTPSVANRLDRNTGGLVICAKTLPGSRKISNMLRERTLHKYYHLVVAGQLDKPGIIEGLLEKDEKSNKVRVFVQDSKAADPGRTSKMPLQSSGNQTGKDKNRSSSRQSASGAYTRTQYRPLEHSADGRLTLVEAELITGKTHQLRAHFASIGHPILGDPKYGNPAINRQYQPLGVRSQLLYCVRIEFPDDQVITTREPAVFTRVMHYVSRGQVQ